MKWNHHKPLLCHLQPLQGFYIPFMDQPKARNDYEIKLPNKGYRNLAYMLDSLIRWADVTYIFTDGSSKGCRYNALTAYYGIYPTNVKRSWALNVGSSAGPHDVSRYELYSRFFGVGALGMMWTEELDTETRLQTYHEYCFAPPDKAVGEAGLYMGLVSRNWEGYVLLARTIIDPPITKYANTLYKEGWRITFPANYTRWFMRILYNIEWYGPADIGILIKNIAGDDRIFKERDSMTGTVDVMIGRDNTAPSPTDYHLKNPIGSLLSQSQSVEIDTTLQECRVVRTGTYTPTTSETLGEVALYINVYDTSGVSQKVMVARGVWPTPITLVAGTTYTIGIVLRMG